MYYCLHLLRVKLKRSSDDALKYETASSYVSQLLFLWQTCELNTNGQISHPGTPIDFRMATAQHNQSFSETKDAIKMDLSELIWFMYTVM